MQAACCRSDTRVVTAPKGSVNMQAWFKNAWEGKLAVWKVVLVMIILPWLVGKLICKLVGIGVFLDWSMNTQRVYLMGCGTMVWGTVVVGNICLWRSARNTEWKILKYATRAGVIFIWIGIVSSLFVTAPLLSKNRRMAERGITPQVSSTVNKNVSPSREDQLLEAAKAGKQVTVKTLLDDGVNINTQDKNPPNVGRTALHYAASAGNQALVEFLLYRGADINAKADTGYTPLHAASGLSQKAVAEVLIRNGADVNAKDVRGTPLHAAVIRGDLDITEMLLKNGSDPNATNRSGETPLHSVSGTIIRTGDHKKIVKSLIAKGSNINAMSGNGETPLIHALSHENNGIAEALVEYGADVTMTGKSATQAPMIKVAQQCSLDLLVQMVKHGAVVLRDGYTPIHAASSSPSCRNREQVLTYLMEHGGNIRAKSAEGLTALHIATNQEVALFLIKNGADVNAQAGDGRTPLAWAVYENIEVVKVLLTHGAQVNLADNGGETALHHTPKPDIAELLIAHGASVNARDKKGRTPLHRHSDYLEGPGTIRVLLINGADIRAQTETGQTPLHLVRSQEVAQVLLNTGADVNAKTIDGLTPLHSVAARGDRIEIIKVLIAHGANVNAKDKDGRTPLHIAVVKDSYGYGVQGIAEGGGDPLIPARDGTTPLQLALERKYNDRARAALEKAVASRHKPSR